MAKHRARIGLFVDVKNLHVAPDLLTALCGDDAVEAQADSLAGELFSPIYYVEGEN